MYDSCVSKIPVEILVNTDGFDLTLIHSIVSSCFTEIRVQLELLSK